MIISTTNPNRKKIGLALGSGGARGLMHIGVIKILLANNIPIDYIAGTSAGALIGAMYAYKEDIESVEKFWFDFNKRQVFDILFDPSGIMGMVKGVKAKKLINKYLEDADFNDLSLSFSAVATSLATGYPKVIDYGNVSNAVKASGSIPFIIAPEVIDGEVMVDGAVSNPVPVDAVRKMGADIVIAVNLDEMLRPISIKNIKSRKSVHSVSKASYNLLLYHLAQKDASHADVVISPMLDENKTPSLIKFDQSEKFVKVGERYAQKAIEEIKSLL